MDKSKELQNIPQAKLDRDALNSVTASALTPGTFFGRGLELTDYDREQFGLIVDEVETVLAPQFQDPEWGTFEALIEEGSKKGAILSFTRHEGTKVPVWCVDGGEQVSVKKILGEGGRPAIEVPTRIFNLYHWKLTSDSLRKYAQTSNEGLKGQMSKTLGEDLRHLAHFLKETKGE